MKEQYNKMISYVKKFFTRKSVKRSGYRAMRDWLILLSVACALVSVFCVIGVYTFFFFHTTPSRSDVPVVSQEMFSSEALSRVVELYRNQTKIHNTLRTNTPAVPLPGKQVKEQADEEEEVIVDGDATEAGQSDGEIPVLQ